MKTPKSDLIRGQSIGESSQELSALDPSQVPDEEYITLLTTHTSHLLELIEKLDLNTESCEGITSTFSFLFGNLTEPVCIIDINLKVIYHNACWAIKYDHFQDESGKNIFFKGINRNIIRETIYTCEKEGKSKIITLKSDTSKHTISFLPFNGLDKGLYFLLFWIDDNFIQEINTISTSNTILPTKTIQTVSDFPERGLQANTFLNAIDGFYFTMDSDLNITSISSTVQKKLGYSSAELTNASIALLLNEKSFQNIKKAVALEFQLSNKKLVQKYRTEIEVLDSRRHIHNFDLTLLHDQESDLFACICVDVQQYKDRERELIHVKTKAERNDKLKSDFLANMSHEIRTPLNGIVGFSTMLNRNHLDQEKRDKYLRIIRTSTMQLLTLVNDIIDISKIEAGQLKMHFTRVEVNQIMEDLLATFIAEAQRLDKKDIKLVKQTGRPHKKFYIKSDEVRLKQVLNNLIGNALKFTIKGEIVFGYTLIDSDSVRFFVRDTGIGISKKDQRSIFSRFKQSREGIKAQYQGTGLGLAISKGIVELMGGKIDVKSYPGKGSEFSFVLREIPQ